MRKATIITQMYTKNPFSSNPSKPGLVISSYSNLTRLTHTHTHTHLCLSGSENYLNIDVTFTLKLTGFRRGRINSETVPASLGQPPEAQERNNFVKQLPMKFNYTHTHTHTNF